MKGVFFVAAFLLLGGIARADERDRLAAVTSLVDDGDDHAITALIAALGSDEARTVRAVAAVGLGKVVTAATPEDLRKQAIDALRAATSKKNESDSFVRKQAAKAYKKLRKLDSAAGDVFVDLGPMASHLNSTNPSDADLTAAMQKTFEREVHRNAKDWMTALPANATQVDAYSVDGAVEEVTTKQANGVTFVGCKVSMEIATYATKTPLASLDAGAKVEATSSSSDIAAATYDCVNAVIESLVPKLIVWINNDSLAGNSTKPPTTAVSAPATEDAAWSSDGWTLLGEDDVDLVDDEVDVNRRKSTWSEVAILVTGDAVQVNTVELALAGKGHKQQHAEVAQSLDADSSPQIIEVTGERRAIDKVRLTYKKHTLDARTRVQVWAR